LAGGDEALTIISGNSVFSPEVYSHSDIHVENPDFDLSLLDKNLLLESCGRQQWQEVAKPMKEHFRCVTSLIW
jgi:hypothetical protein